jgi:4-hydroxyphenylpyruvate dioxygenase
METQTAPTAPPARADDEMPLLGIDHIELYVGNAVQAAYFFTHGLGFAPTAVAGLETGVRDRASHVVEHGRVRFVLTAPLHGSSEIGRHVAEHGDGAKVVALSVPDAEEAYRVAVRRGARGVREPWEDSDEEGTVRMATIATYGETVHTLLDRSHYDGVFAPGYVAVDSGPNGGAATGAPPVGLTHIDHVVGNVEKGKMADWVRYYETALGFEPFTQFTKDQIATEYSALESTVMWNRGRVLLPINEPAEGRRKSQIEEYLDYYGAPGVQHLALSTPDIVTAVRSMRQRGVKFLTIPPEYYEDARVRMEGVDLNWDALSELGILVDRDEDGYLLQIFTQPVCDRPTVFFEIIQREGCRGFGEGNFKALFEAIERAQAERGNL